MKREKRSRIVARYSFERLSPMYSSVVSPTQRWLGAFASNLRSCRALVAMSLARHQLFGLHEPDDALAAHVLAIIHKLAVYARTAVALLTTLVRLANEHA
jgi:hypothetical protein